MESFSIPLLQIAIGLVLLVTGANWLVRGASRLALALGIAPLVVGLTVVAIGTSTPELSVSLRAAWAGSPGIVLGNVIGSNIANILLILGLVALLFPLTANRQLVRRDVPLMIAASLAVVLMTGNGVISRFEGLLLLAGAIGYICLLIRIAHRHPEQAPSSEVDESAKSSGHGWLQSLMLIVVGLALLAFGSKQLVAGATALATAVGLSELVIGLTVVAVGTSLPEITTALVAAARGQRDLAVGNVVGSNLFNLLLVLGSAAALAPDGIEVSAYARAFDLPVMLSAAIVCLPIFFTGHRIARWEGAVFLMYYVAYITYLLMQAGAHGALDQLEFVMRWVVIPLTALTLSISLIRALRNHANRTQTELNPP